MDDLISKKRLLKMMSHWKPYMDMGLVRQAVERMPTVDAVEVVRCKDCISHNECRFEQYQGLNGFCSYGERKTNEND